MRRRSYPDTDGTFFERTLPHIVERARALPSLAGALAKPLQLQEQAVASTQRLPRALVASLLANQFLCTCGMPPPVRAARPVPPPFSHAARTRALSGARGERAGDNAFSRPRAGAAVSSRGTTRARCRGWSRCTACSARIPRRCASPVIHKILVTRGIQGTHGSRQPCVTHCSIIAQRAMEPIATMHTCTRVPPRAAAITYGSAAGWTMAHECVTRDTTRRAALLRAGLSFPNSGSWFHSTRIVQRTAPWAVH